MAPLSHILVLFQLEHLNATWAFLRLGWLPKPSGYRRLPLEMIERQLERMLQDTEEFSENYRIMKAIKGVGPITAGCFIIRTHNFKYMNKRC